MKYVEWKDTGHPILWSIIEDSSIEYERWVLDLDAPTGVKDGTYDGVYGWATDAYNLVNDPENNKVDYVPTVDGEEEEITIYAHKWVDRNGDDVPRTTIDNSYRIRRHGITVKDGKFVLKDTCDCIYQMVWRNEQRLDWGDEENEKRIGELQAEQKWDEASKLIKKYPSKDGDPVHSRYVEGLEWNGEYFRVNMGS